MTFIYKVVPIHNLIGAARGATSIAGVYTAIQGGNGGGVWGASGSGGSGGGGAGGSHGGTGIPNNGASAQFPELGNAGGDGTTANPGGGGGAGSAGANNKAGDGKTSKIDNRVYQLIAGGGVGIRPPTQLQTQAAAGMETREMAGKAGASGVVIVRVAVDSPSLWFAKRCGNTIRTATAARVENGVVQQVIVIPHLDDEDKRLPSCNVGLSGTWFDTSFYVARREPAEVGDLFDLNTRNAEFIPRWRFRNEYRGKDG